MNGRFIALLLLLCICSIAASAQPRPERPVPFRVGESLTYDVSWSSYLTAGTAVTTVKEKKPSYNSTAYYIVAEGRPLPIVAELYPVYYKIDTLLDSYTLLSQRGSVYIEEGRRHRYRTTLFDRKTQSAHFEARAETVARADFTTSPVAQDALAAVYALRAVPFKPGDRMTMPVCDNGVNYTLQIDVSGPENVRSGLGTIGSTKLNVTVLDDRSQRVGRNAAIWMSNDPRRLPLRLQAELPVGSFNLVLRDVRQSG